MLSRALLSLALLFGMLFAPVAMAPNCASMPMAEQTASHYADDDADQHMPTKQQAHCMGACSGVNMAVVTRFPARIASPLAPVPISATSLPSGVLLDRDTPPPRFP